ncbi:3'-phosphoadenosine 5'-phosphosulfate (PAPS) 3'-phosphatase [Brevundimonas sp. SORGH_AS 993]|nr:3'-phosphoadenosine 5'-phosphosulfate (PAPS) 3'-phosphatase [Brevundimonas sp. SORGH_AS_0993]
MKTPDTDRLAQELKSGALTLAIADIAEEAARLILPYWRVDTAVETKSDDSPVTQADRAAEALILKRLEALYPGVQTVAEEAVAADGVPGAVQDWFWLIDPLDGTRGFVRGGEAFTVNIALIHAGYPVAGVVTAPATATTWRSDRPDGGAFRRQFGALQAGEAHAGEEWRPIRVRDRPAEGMALLSHSISDEEAARLAARHGCAHWQGTDSLSEILPDRRGAVRRLSPHRPDLGMGHRRRPGGSGGGRRADAGRGRPAHGLWQAWPPQRRLRRHGRLRRRQGRASRAPRLRQNGLQFAERERGAVGGRPAFEAPTLVQGACVQSVEAELIVEARDDGLGRGIVARQGQGAATVRAGRTPIPFKIMHGDGVERLDDPRHGQVVRQQAAGRGFAAVQRRDPSVALRVVVVGVDHDLAGQRRDRNASVGR